MADVLSARSPSASISLSSTVTGEILAESLPTPLPGLMDVEEMEMDTEEPTNEQNVGTDIEGEVFPGYGKEDEDDMFHKIDLKSRRLHTKVKELESQHAATIAELFALSKDPVGIPNPALAPGASVFIERMIIRNNNETRIYVTGVGKIIKCQRSRRPTDDEGGHQLDELYPPKRRVLKQKAPEPFTDQELQLLRRPLILGWIRDVVLKSQNGSGMGYVTYHSPEGDTVESNKTLSVALAKSMRKGNLSLTNFSFTALPIGGSKNEMLRMADDDANIEEFQMDFQSAPIAPRKRRRPGQASMNSAGSSPYGIGVGDSPGSAQKKRRRGGRQPPPRSTLMEKMQENDSEGGLFGISALSEIFAGMEKADCERELQEYNHMMNLMAAQENVLEALEPSGSAPMVNEDGELVPRDEILPCSIRCPEMTGKIPGLQCTRCLCLYHAECLGFPDDDFDSSNFLCSNCEGSGSPTFNPSDSPPKHGMYELMHKMLEIKGSPASKSYSATPSPSPLRQGFQGFGKGVSIKKIDQKTGNLSPIGGSPRNRRIPPIPQLTSHNLTITPLLPYSKGQIPRVPTLSPIHGPRNLSAGIPVFKRGRGGFHSTFVDSIQVNPQRKGNLSKLPFAPFGAVDNKPRKTYPIPNFSASFGTVQQPTSNVFRTYPQSVVSVGQRKFIVIPKSPPPQVMEIFENAVPKKCQEFGKQGHVLAQVFSYLTVKDLLKASHVNSTWKEQAAEPGLWVELKLKNTRIYDMESFCDFVAARETETIDFRKMLGFADIDWSLLFSKLGAAPSLRTLILGSRAEELADLAQKECPHLEVI